MGLICARSLRIQMQIVNRLVWNALAVKAGVPVPSLSAAISYYDSFRAEVLPANLLQAQRDYFGAHTYERTDRPGNYHYSWYEEQ